MKQIVIFFIFVGNYQILYPQNNNSLKQELVQILTHNQYPQIQHFTTIAYLYTGYQTSPKIPAHSKFGHYVLPSSYGITYNPGKSAKTIISPDKQYKAFIFSPTQNTTSLCVSNISNNKLVKLISLSEQKLLHLQFYPKILLFACKEPQIDIMHLHKLPLNKIDPEITFTFKLISPTIGYIPEKDITLISGDCSDTNPFNIIILNPAFKKHDVLDKHTDVVNAFASNAKAPFFASASEDGNVILWKPFNQEFDTKITCAEILTHNAPVKCICIDPDGKYLISGTHNNKKEVHFYVWDLLSKTCIFNFPLKYYIFDPMLISCSWNGQGKNIDEVDTQSIILESDKFYYETTPEKLFEVIEMQKKCQESNNNNTVSLSINVDSAVDELTAALSANLKLENDTSTMLISTDASPDTSSQNRGSTNSNDNSSSTAGNALSNTDNPASIGSGRTPSY